MKGEVIITAMRGSITTTELLDQELTLNPGTPIRIDKDVTQTLLEDISGDLVNVTPKVTILTVDLGNIKITNLNF